MKEIVITNPNGITLNTKKTLVDDDIKILLDQSLLNQGGSGKLKLVASVENAIGSEFEIPNIFQKGKYYLLKLDIGHCYYTLFHLIPVEFENYLDLASTSATTFDILDRIVKISTIQYYPETSSLYFYSEDLSAIDFQEDTTGAINFEIYELPMTFEDSEPTSNIKVAEIEGVYDEENEIFTFKKDGLNIDYLKGFRIKIFKNNNNIEILDYYGLGKLLEHNDYIICHVYGYDNYGSYEYNSGFTNMPYIDGTIFNNDEFDISFTSDLANYLDDLTLKLYYVEANELTTPFTYEM